MENNIIKIIEEISAAQYSSYKSKDHPKAFMVVGQPGAGKTQIIKKICEEKVIAFINGDSYRKFYPNYHALYKKYGDEIVNITKDFSGKVTEGLIEELSNKKIDLIIEGTLRTTNVPEKTRALLSQKNYQVELDLIVVKPEISWLRTLKRYSEMKTDGTIPRLTAKDHHDAVVRNLQNNLKTLYLSKKFSEIKLYQQKKNNLEIIYSMQKTPTIDPSSLLNREFNRKYTTKEIYQIKNEFKNYISLDELNTLFKGKIKQSSLTIER